MLISNYAFMRTVDYYRQRHKQTIQHFCDDIGIQRKDYDYYLKGIKTPPPGFVIAVIKYFGLEGF